MKLLLTFCTILFLGSFSCMTSQKTQPAAVSPDIFTTAKPDTTSKTPEATKPVDPAETQPPQITPSPTNINVNIQVNTQNPSLQPASSDSLFASLERTPCYGKCPTYKVSVYRSGFAVYEGKRFVDKIGKYATRLTTAELQSLAEKARQINYFNLDDVYDSQVTDVPSTITSMNLDGRKKNIKARFNVPAQLREFERFFDGLFAEKSWIPISIE